MRGSSERRLWNPGRAIEHAETGGLAWISVKRVKRSWWSPSRSRSPGASPFPSPSPCRYQSPRRYRHDDVLLDVRRHRAGEGSVSEQTAAPPERLTADDVLRAGEVAKLLGIPVSTVHDQARRGILPSTKIGRHRLFLRPQIEALLCGGD
jgi:excisionase family DNA binding protein